VVQGRFEEEKLGSCHIQSPQSPLHKDINSNNNQYKVASLLTFRSSFKEAKEPIKTNKLKQQTQTNQQATTTITTNVIHHHPFTNDDNKFLTHKYYFPPYKPTIKLKQPTQTN